jgi:RNA polymerase-binding transcription factor DksA
MRNAASSRPHRFSAPDLAAAQAAVQRSLARNAPQDCDACGERIPPEERVASPMALRCSACGQALDYLGRVGRSPLCNL